MTEFDPAALLKQLRSKTPTKVPDLPPRPVSEEPSQKYLQFEERLSALEHQLKITQQNEQKYLKERDLAYSQLKENQAKASETESRLLEKIKFLEAMIERDKHRVKNDEKTEEKSKTPVKIEPKRPAFSSAVSSNSARYTTSKQKGFLDLNPLIELYKIMPDFPRPVIKIDFSSVKINN
jgi:hypothetical protein